MSQAKTIELEEAMKTFEFMTRLDGQFTNVAVQDIIITEFGVSCYPVFTKKGHFSKWMKRGYIIAGSVMYPCAYHFIADIKAHFKGQFVTRKATHVQYKHSPRGFYLGERKATDWAYTINQ